jgi:hypothetical protein
MNHNHVPKTKYNLNKEEIIEMFKVKKTKEIAEFYGCCVTNVNHFCKKNGIQIPKINLIGKKFHMLEVIEKLDVRGESGRQSQYWKVLCACGNTKDLTTKDINSSINSKRYRSCGCWIKSKDFREKHYLWKGHNDIHGKWWTNLKRGAKHRGHNFEITIEYAWEIFCKQNKKCAISGLDIWFGKTTRDIEHGATTASIDRINNNEGYVVGNIHWVHKDINLMKQKFSMEKFLEYCRLIVASNPTI